MPAQSLRFTVRQLSEMMKMKIPLGHPKADPGVSGQASVTGMKNQHTLVVTNLVDFEFGIRTTGGSNTGESAGFDNPPAPSGD